MNQSLQKRKQRYSVRPFSPGQDGIWDKRAQDFVKNPDSGRKKLFYYRASAQKLCDKLNQEQEVDTCS